MAWSTERIELLKELWSKGLTAGQISLKLGDVTRNAIIGKVHRLGLSGRRSKTATTNITVDKKAPKPRAKVAKASVSTPPAIPAITPPTATTAEKKEKSPNIISVGISLWNRRDDQCPQIIGSDKDGPVCCGNAMGKRDKVCTEHAKTNFVPQPRGKRSGKSDEIYRKRYSFRPT